MTRYFVAVFVVVRKVRLQKSSQNASHLDQFGKLGA